MKYPLMHAPHLPSAGVGALFVFWKRLAQRCGADDAGQSERNHDGAANHHEDGELARDGAPP